MGNKRNGNAFEREFAELLANHWFWVHIFQDNKNGQPCDIIAARSGKSYLFDCKDCEETFFRLDRMEENQINAMKLFDITGNGKGMFVVRVPEKGIYLLTFERLQELEEAGFKRINETVCRTQGVTLEEWLDSLKDAKEWGDYHGTDDWK